LLAEAAAEAEIEAGRVDQDGELRFAARGFLFHAAPIAPHRRKLGDHFENSDHGHGMVVGDHVDAGRAHLFAAQAKQLGAGSRGERGRQPRSIHFARGFTGGDQHHGSGAYGRRHEDVFPEREG
jgi:hypothetical protein